MTPPSFYVNTEGHKLGRSGTLDLLEIHVLPLWETFIVDVFTLKHAAFDTSFGGNSLRVLLQSPSVSKVFFDVRNDSDALFSHYKIILDGVVDLQLMEFFRGGRTGLSLRSLKRCIQRDGGLNSDQFRQWAQVKGEVDHSSREAGLDDLPLHKRPLLANLLLYATGDVVHLPLLYRAYRQKLSKQAWGQVQSETEKGLRQSRQPEYDPHARGKERGLARLPIHGNALNIATDGPGEANATLDQPEVKRPRNKSTLKPQLASHQRKPARPAVRNMEINSSFSIMARLHTLSLAVDPCESSAQASEVTDQMLRHRPVTFVKEGYVPEPRKQKKKKKQKQRSVSGQNSGGAGPLSRHDPFSHSFSDNLDWALCDKDCGWCGHCYEGFYVIY